MGSGHDRSLIEQMCKDWLMLNVAQTVRWRWFRWNRIVLAEFAGLIGDEIAKWAKVVKFAGMRAE
jgi:hypothetical protein